MRGNALQIMLFGKERQIKSDKSGRVGNREILRGVIYIYGIKLHYQENFCIIEKKFSERGRAFILLLLLTFSFAKQSGWWVGGLCLFIKVQP